MHDLNETLAEMQAKTDAATRGPWWGGGDKSRRGGHNPVGLVGRAADRGTGNAIAVLAGIGMDRVADAEFIAMARAAMPALLSAVRNVLALHQPYPIKHMLICEDCSESWPCSTVKALTDALEGGE